MIQELSPIEALIATVYPFSWLILLVLSILVSLWLILHVEYADRFSIPKTTIAITIIALAGGFGVHLLLFFMGL
ncbi:MAG: hypothetical protein ACTSW4_03250 [Candidatus Ranarchaeia archaeon]